MKDSTQACNGEGKSDVGGQYISVMSAMEIVN